MRYWRPVYSPLPRAYKYSLIMKYSLLEYWITWKTIVFQTKKLDSDLLIFLSRNRILFNPHPLNLCQINLYQETEQTLESPSPTPNPTSILLDPAPNQQPPGRQQHSLRSQATLLPPTHRTPTCHISKTLRNGCPTPSSTWRTVALTFLIINRVSFVQASIFFPSMALSLKLQGVTRSVSISLEMALDIKCSCFSFYPPELFVVVSVVFAIVAIFFFPFLSHL